MANRFALAAAVTLLLAAGTARADSFAPMPRLNKDSKHLKIRWVEYRGGTNGSMVIEVKNTARRPVTFEASGLYFVPDGEPSKAPQRLGASGPLLIASGKSPGGYKEKLVLAPGQTQRVALDVFCIDSHRSSPNSSTAFSVAKKRLPKKLRRELKATNDQIYRKHKKNYAAAPAKSAVQSNMWKVRDKDWVELEGEAEGEAAMKRQRPAPVQQRNRRKR